MMREGARARVANPAGAGRSQRADLEIGAPADAASSGNAATSASAHGPRVAQTSKSAVSRVSKPAGGPAVRNASPGRTRPKTRGRCRFRNRRYGRFGNLRYRGWAAMRPTPTSTPSRIPSSGGVRRDLGESPRRTGVGHATFSCSCDLYLFRVWRRWRWWSARGFQRRRARRICARRASGLRVWRRHRSRVSGGRWCRC